MVTSVLLNLPEECGKIIENLEDELDDNIDPLTIKIYWDKL